MAFINTLLRVTNFRSPFLRTLVPSVGAAFALQAAVAVPSVLTQSERFYDLSGSLTFVSVTALSLYLPHLRLSRAAAAAAASAGSSKIPPPSSLLSVLTGSGSNWRQVALSAAVLFWSIRLGSYLFQRVLQQGHDSRFDEIKKSPPKFLGAFFAQATWVSLCMMPIIAVNAVPAAAFTAVSSSSSSSVQVTDILGFGLFLGGITFEMVADYQKSRWLAGKREKTHDEEFMTAGLWSRSQFPNYFGEMTLWTGIATAAAGVLVTTPVQLGLGFSGGVAGRALAVGISVVSPSFVTFLLTKVSGIPLSEGKYDKRYGDRKDYQMWKQNTPKLFPKLW